MQAVQQCVMRNIAKLYLWYHIFFFWFRSLKEIPWQWENVKIISCVLHLKPCTSVNEHGESVWSAPHCSRLFINFPLSYFSVLQAVEIKFGRHWMTATARCRGNAIMLLVTGLAWMHTTVFCSVCHLLLTWVHQDVCNIDADIMFMLLYI